jgi:hypothetical protein
VKAGDVVPVVVGIAIALCRDRLYSGGTGILKSEIFLFERLGLVGKFLYSSIFCLVDGGLDLALCN